MNRSVFRVTAVGYVGAEFVATPAQWQALFQVELRSARRHYWVKLGGEKIPGREGLHQVETWSGSYRLTVGRGRKDLACYDLDIPADAECHALTLTITDSPTGPEFRFSKSSPARGE